MLGRNPGENALLLERQRAIADMVYQKRFGNNQPGDGWKYRGGGLIQTTFLDNYRATGNGIKLDLVSNPELIEQDQNAARSAAWFFLSKGCLQWAGAIMKFTQVINFASLGLILRLICFLPNHRRFSCKVGFYLGHMGMKVEKAHRAGTR